MTWDLILGSSGETTRVVVVGQKLKKRKKKMDREQSDGEDSTPETEVVLGGVDTGGIRGGASPTS